jgi:hypothetical protein
MLCFFQTVYLCQQLQTVSSYKLSAATNCQQLQTVSSYKLSAATNCQQLQTVSSYKLSAATNCQQLQNNGHHKPFEGCVNTFPYDSSNKEQLYIGTASTDWLQRRYNGK